MNNAVKTYVTRRYRPSNLMFVFFAISSFIDNDLSVFAENIDIEEF